MNSQNVDKFVAKVANMVGMTEVAGARCFLLLSLFKSKTDNIERVCVSCFSLV